jgi:multiple sugar transport system permease protein
MVKLSVRHARLPKRTSAYKHALVGYAFLLPNIFGFLVFTLGPILFSFIISFFDWNVFTTPTFIDTENYARIFFSKDSEFWSYFGNTMFFLIVIPVQMALALTMAYLLNQKLRGTLIFKVIYFVPIVVSVVSIAILWEYILDAENGLLNQILTLVGIRKVAWLAEPQWIKPGISMMVIWQSAAFGTIIYFAALQGVPEHLYEAATIDGANKWKQFWRITFPLLTPSHFFLLITGFIGTLQLFAPIYVMTHGVPGSARTMIFEVYWKAYHEFEMGYASALSWVLFLLIFLVSGLQWRYIGKRVHYA